MHNSPPTHFERLCNRKLTVDAALRFALGREPLAPPYDVSEGVWYSLAAGNKFRSERTPPCLTVVGFP